MMWPWICNIFERHFNHNNDDRIWTVYCGKSRYGCGSASFFNVISTLMATMWSSLHNHYYRWNPLEQWCKSMLISCIATIYCLDYIITVIVEILLKNGARNIYTLLYLEKLPYLVSPITKWTLPLNSHWKTGPGHI